MNEPLIEFNPKLPKLSANEKAVLKLLVEAGKLIVPLYLEQEKQKLVSREEIEKAAKKDPEALSPYTVVEKIDGKFVVTPYHIKYVTFLKPIAEKLEKAASISENKGFAKALKVQAKALLDGSYEEAIATWLKLEPYILDISIGPIEYHSARLSFAKSSYHAWIGTLDKEGTERLNRYKKIILTIRRRTLLPRGRIDNLELVKTKTIDVILFSGSIAQIKFVGVNLPIDISIVEKHGSEITIFNQPNDLRMKEQILPAFEQVFPKSFREGYSLEDLRRGSLRTVAMHELAHSYLYYNNAREGLQDLFITIYELTATILGLRLAGTLLLEDVITNKQLESMILAHICRSIYLKEKGKSNPYLTSPVLGSTVLINFLFENGALKQKGEFLIPNFMKIFVALHELLGILEQLLASGAKKDAEALLKKYA